MTHAVPDAPAPVPPQQTGEPVVIAHAVSVILGALVSLGWLTIPNPTIDMIGSGVWLIVSTAAAIVARSKVAPVHSIADFEAYVAGLIRDELAAYPQFRDG